MENETVNQNLNASVPVVDERLNKKVGTIEAENLQAKPIQCQGVKLVEKFNKITNKKSGDIAVLICKHPDKEELIEVSQVQVIQGQQVKEVGLWYNEDNEKNIQKGSALSEVIAFNKVENLNDLVGKELETVVKSNGFLVIKVY